MTWKPIGKEDDIPLGEMKYYSALDMDIVVYHLDDGWYATSDMCTHQDCSLSESGEVEDDEIICWCHGGAFDIRTGRATRMPCTAPIETFSVRLSDGIIEIDIS